MSLGLNELKMVVLHYSIFQKFYRIFTGFYLISPFCHLSFSLSMIPPCVLCSITVLDCFFCIWHKWSLGQGGYFKWWLLSSLFCCGCIISYYQLIQVMCFRDHLGCAPSQWKTTLQCNVVSHWLGHAQIADWSPWLPMAIRVASLAQGQFPSTNRTSEAALTNKHS